MSLYNKLVVKVAAIKAIRILGKRKKEGKNERENDYL